MSFIMNKQKTDKQSINPKNPKNLGAHGSLKSLEHKRKQVYKPVLDNPYIKSNNWPYVDQKLGADLTELLCRLLGPIKKYNEFKSKKTETNFNMEEPDILPHITMGFNSTNKALETMSKFNRGQIKKLPSLNISIIFVCKVDISPVLLTQHLPLLTFMASTKEAPVKLVQLPRGSMDQLSSACGQKSLGFIGVSGDAPGINVLKSLVFDKVQDVDIPWLSQLNFQPPNIKLLVTSQPITSKKNNQKVTKKDKVLKV